MHRRNVARMEQVLTSLREPAVPILLLAGAVQVYREYPADILIFFGTVTLILWDTRRWSARVASTTPRPVSGRTRRTVFAACVVFAVVAGLIPRTSDWLDVAFAVPGLVMVGAIVRRTTSTVRTPVADENAPTPTLMTAPPAPSAASAVDPASPMAVPPTRRAGARRQRPPRGYVWPVLGVVLALLELSAFLSQSGPRTDNPDRPTLSTIVEPWLANTPLRMLTLGLWLAAGWWMLRRVLAWQARSR